MTLQHWLGGAGLALFAGLSPVAYAVNLGLDNWGQFEYAFDEETVVWTEVQAKLPASPKAENLSTFSIDLRPGYGFAIDRASLSIGADGVVRYTMLITSPSGARTINFEGMRCSTGERKIYAFGRPDGSWSKNRGARWDAIQARAQAGYSRVLFHEFICAGGDGTPTKVEQILQRLQHGGSFAY